MAEMSNRAKGRWVASAIVAIVTVTWMAMANRDGATAFLAAGMLIGGPYALAAGGVLGSIAGRLDRHREIVLVALALVAALALDALPWLIVVANGCTDDAMLPALLVLSLVPTVAGALWLERWTRPVPAIAPATSRRTR